MKFNRWIGTALLGVLFLAAASNVRSEGNEKAIDDYNVAAWLYNTGKYALAVDSYQAFLKNYPKHEKNAEALFGLAQSLFHLDRFADAAARYEEVRSAARDFPQMPELLFQLGQSRAALTQYAEAEKLFAELQSKFAEHYLADWALARRAACLVSMNKFKEAEDILAPFVEKYAAGGKAPDKTPAAQDMLRKLDQAGIKAGDAFLALVERSVFYKALARFEQGRFDEARQDFEAFEKQFPKSPLLAEAGFRLAQSLYRQEKFSEAAAAYKAVAEGTGEFAASAAFERGLALHKSKDLKAASAAFADVAKRFPESAGAPKARLYAGTCLFAAADYSGAIEQLRPLAESDKQPAEALYWIGMSQLKSGKPADAEKAFTDAMKGEPPQPLNGDIQLGLADARLAQNQFVTAAEAFRGYAQKNPKAESAARALYSASVALHRADKYSESDDACGELLRASPTGELAAQALFLSGENRFLQKKYDDAARRYEELLERKDAPADRTANAHYRLAWVHRYAGRHDRALEELGRMNAADAGKTVTAEALYLKGVCFFEKTKYPEAAEALRAYLGSEDRSRFGDDARLKLAVCMAKQNLKKEAIDEFQQFLRDYPNSELASQARYQQAECLYDLKDFGRAAEQYREVAKREPPDDLTPYALFGAASCAYEQSKWAASATEFGALAAKFKDSVLAPQALYRQGKSLMNLSRWADAEAALRALIAAAPKDTLARPAQIAIGTCLQEQKKWSEAAEAFRASIHNHAAGDDQSRLQYEMAWSLREAGEKEKAKAAFQTLADKYPGDALAADAFFYMAEALYTGRPQGSAEPSASADDAKILDEARRMYEKALAASKDQRLTDKAHYRIGWCFWLTRKYTEAAAEFDKLIKDCPASELVADARFQAGASYAKAGEASNAVERFQTLIDSPAAKGFAYLPETYVALGENLLILQRPDDAIKALTVFLDKYEKHASASQAFFLKGKAQYGLKKHDEALKSFSEVTRMTKSDLAAQAQFYIGQIHQGQDDFKTAILDYLRIQALYPEAREWLAASTFESAKCFDALGQKADARKAYQDVADNYKDTKWAGLAADRLK